MQCVYYIVAMLWMSHITNKPQNSKGMYWGVVHVPTTSKVNKLDYVHIVSECKSQYFALTMYISVRNSETKNCVENWFSYVAVHELCPGSHVAASGSTSYTSRQTTAAVV